jgi:pimeloyl-ACP methyl ester carboxylesterase
MVKPLFRPKFMKGLKERIYKRISADDYTATPNLKETFLKIINEDLSGYLPKINQPTLIIWGENDKTTPLGDAKIMKEKIKNSKLVVLENAGHSCFLNKPKEFYDELIKFIR